MKNNMIPKYLPMWSGLATVLFWSSVACSTNAAESSADGLDEPLTLPAPSLWQAGVGEGFTRGAKELSLSGGIGFGSPIFGSIEHHDWVIGVVEFGWVFSEVQGKGHWYQGNFELLGDLFGGMQFHPEHAYLVGMAPILRYDFATGTRFVPFVDIGGGVTSTDIRNPDLSTPFEFNLQLGGGTHYFLRENLALTVQYRFIHLSNAGISSPNLGVNTSTIFAGVSWFF